MAVKFVDSSYWIARIYPKDNLYRQALNISQTLVDSELVTSDSVLIEVLNKFSRRGGDFRESAARYVNKIFKEGVVKVIPQNRKHYMKALELYTNRSDKAYSLTDCMSMIIMNEYHIKQVLTSDRHFEQEGFEMLMKSIGS